MKITTSQGRISKNGNLDGMSLRLSQVFISGCIRKPALEPYALTKWHPLLKVDEVRWWKFRDMLGMKPTEQIGHCEYTDEELDGDDVRPIPVHIRS